MRRHTEIVLVYFFESFFRKLTRDIFFKEKTEEGQIINLLDCKSSLFIMAKGHQNIFDTFDNYLILTINKCLGNLALGDKVVGRYSISYLKLMVEELKRQLSQHDFNKISIPTHISKELLNINSTNLSDPTFFKLRSDLYEIISICFLDEAREDYIENMHVILERIFELDLSGANAENPVQSPYQELGDHVVQRYHRSCATNEGWRGLPYLSEGCVQASAVHHQRSRPQTHHKRDLCCYFAGIL